MQPMPEIMGHFMREARTHAACVGELAILVITKNECADRARINSGRGVAGNDEFLPSGTLGLDPVAVASGAVGRGFAFGDDAFEADPAGMLQQDRSLFLEMFAEPNRTIGRQVVKKAAQALLALNQRDIGEIAAIEVQYVERIIHKTIPAALGEGLLQL